MNSVFLLYGQKDISAVGVKKLAKNGNGLLKHLKVQLSLTLGDDHLDDPKMDAAHCKASMSEILKNSMNANLTLAIMLNKTELLAVPTGFSYLNGKTGQIVSRLVASKRNLHDASEKILSCAEFAIQSEAYAKEAVTQVLRHVTRELCGTLRNLRMLCLNIDSLGKTAREIKMNLSMLKRQICVMRQKMHETVEKMPSVAQCVEVPRVELALVKHVIRRGRQRHKVVLKEISNFLLGGVEFVKGLKIVSHISAIHDNLASKWSFRSVVMRV
ncbi:hypothetical protein TRVL_07965 [Trypanosoma vivax]|nr:hypothetical protein TRVL_07965 [Trypanosoma vivax]